MTVTCRVLLGKQRESKRLTNFKIKLVNFNKVAAKTPWPNLETGAGPADHYLPPAHRALSSECTSEEDWFSDTSLCECGQADQTPDHILQSCSIYTERHQLTWLQNADLATKLWGSAEDLYRTTGFVESTGLKIWPTQLLIAEEEAAAKTVPSNSGFPCWHSWGAIETETRMVVTCAPSQSQMCTQSHCNDKDLAVNKSCGTYIRNIMSSLLFHETNDMQPAKLIHMLFMYCRYIWIFSWIMETHSHKISLMTSPPFSPSPFL